MTPADQEDADFSIFPGVPPEGCDTIRNRVDGLRNLGISTRNLGISRNLARNLGITARSQESPGISRNTNILYSP